MNILDLVRLIYELCSALRVVIDVVHRVAAAAKKLVRRFKARGGATDAGLSDGGSSKAEVTDTLDEKGC
ncbi:MAG: hypothetical protein KHY83_10220 [Coriobacteriia bacterium]|nr:hypothetical protein [Coriobacteriia bacterium]MBS5479024.1 hypothetical protein [Coriobacteriia bacterium]